MKTVPATAAGYAEALRALQADEVVAHPTETVYGLAVNPFSVAALDRLFAIKGRDPGRPLVLIVSGMDQVQMVARFISPRAREYMKQFWPGPLSLVLPRQPSLPPVLTGGGDKICVRCSSSEVARELCRLFERPLTSTSANLTGHPPAQSAAEVKLTGVAVLIDGGRLDEALPSTVFDPDEMIVYREGAITKRMLDATVVSSD
jgi:L-threonylcarbamoyladenylate synthase